MANAGYTIVGKYLTAYVQNKSFQIYLFVPSLFRAHLASRGFSVQRNLILNCLAVAFLSVEA